MKSAARTRAVFGTLLILLIAGLVAAASTEKPDFGLEYRGDWIVEDGETRIVTPAWTRNPNSVGTNISFLEVDYEVRMNNISVGQGEKQGLYFPAGERTEFNLTTDINEEKLPELWVSHLRNNETSNFKVPATLRVGSPLPLKLEGNAYSRTFRTDITGRLEESLSYSEGVHSRQLMEGGPETRVEVSNVSVEWGDISREETEVILSFDLHNLNSYPIPEPRPEGSTSANGIEVAEWNYTRVPEEMIEPGETRRIRFQADIDNQKADEVFVSHVRRDERSSVKSDIQMVLNMGDERVKIPGGSSINCNATVQTSVLEDQRSRRTFHGCSLPEGSRSDIPVRALGAGNESEAEGMLERLSSHSLDYYEETLENMFPQINITSIEYGW